MTEKTLTQDRLKQLLKYDENNHRFIWICKSSIYSNVEIGSVAGCVYTATCKKKYRVITIDNKPHKEHRLVWLYFNGEFPINEIDHIDGDGLNNDISNLRDVKRADNGKNKKLSIKNKHGCSGVYFNKRAQKYRSHIMVDGKSVHLGYFGELDEAVIVRKLAETKYGFHKNHGDNRPL